MIFGKKAKQYMKSKGIKQNELARQIGKSSSGISTALRDDGNPSEEMMLSIADGLGIPLWELLREDNDGISVMSNTEKKLIEDFRLLNQQGREYVLQSMQMAVRIYISGESADLPGVENWAK